MKKVIVTLVALVALITNAQAQKFTIGAGANVGLPVGDAADISSVTVGGELQGEYSFILFFFFRSFSPFLCILF